MVLNREEAAQVAEKKSINIPGTCQLVTRGYFGAPSVGDFDGDGAADAEDGWKSEPISARHSDRNPPRGTPVAFTGGRNDFGHRAISIGGSAPIRSTDFNGSTRRYHAGVIGNGTISEVAAAIGVTYVGWSDTIDGVKIPLPPVAGPLTRGANVDKALKSLARAERKAKDGTNRDTLLKKAIAVLAKITPRRKK